MNHRYQPPSGVVQSRNVPSFLGCLFLVQQKGQPIHVGSPKANTHPHFMAVWLDLWTLNVSGNRVFFFHWTHKKWNFLQRGQQQPSIWFHAIGLSRGHMPKDEWTSGGGAGACAPQPQQARAPVRARGSQYVYGSKFMLTPD